MEGGGFTYGGRDNLDGGSLRLRCQDEIKLRGNNTGDPELKITTIKEIKASRMAQQSSLSEWLIQTKKVSKSVDYVCLDVIDSVISCLPFCNHEIISNNADFFKHYCDKYHKPNPVQLQQRPLQKRLRRSGNGDTAQVIDVVNKYLIASINRCRRLMDLVTWQWFEIIDFMFERPELVNPDSIDSYVRDCIAEVCANNKKNNPLKNGIFHRFGKYWKDVDGHWWKERRKRF